MVSKALSSCRAVVASNSDKYVYYIRNNCYAMITDHFCVIVHMSSNK